MSIDLPLLPTGWAWTTVAEVGFVQLGRQRAPQHHDGPHMRPYLRVANIFEDRVDVSDILSMNFEPGEFERYKLKAGDILLNEGQSLELVGRPAMYRDEVPGACFQNTLVRFTAKEVIEARYALLLFRLYLHNGRFQKIARWTTNIAHLGAERFAGLELPLAPKNEQQRIVEALDSYLSRLDSAVASLQKVQTKLKAYRASVLKAAVEGRLVPTEAEIARREGRDFEPAPVLLARILKERRRRWEEAELARMKKAGKTPKDDAWKAKYQEPEAPDTSKLPSLPEGWCWASVEQLASDEPNALCDGPFGSNLKTEHYTEDGPRVVRLQNIGDGDFLPAEAHIAADHFSMLRRHEVFEGDLVVASLGVELPKAAMIPPWLGPAIVKADCLRFRVDAAIADARFVMHALNAPPTRVRTEQVVHGVGRPRIGLNLFRQTAVPLPPPEEQRRLVEEVDRLLSVATSATSSARADEMRCGRLRQSILKWAFEGKLVDQDPNDEPAEELLARIRAEREAAPTTKTRGRKAKSS